MNLPGPLSPAALAGLVALVGVAVYDVVVPKSPPAASQKALALQLQRKERDANLARENLQQLDNEIARLVWTRPPDEFAPFAMRQVGDWARAQGLRLTSMRPQKAEPASEAVQLNFLATVEGSFPALGRFLESFEAESSIVSVRSVQLAGGDGSGDNVRATVGLVAYRPKEPTTNG
jgi:Tfp pilus assembly protein PilO